MDNRKRLILDLIILGICLLLIGSVIVLMIYMGQEGPKCTLDPIEYYQNLKNATCYCDLTIKLPN